MKKPRKGQQITLNALIGADEVFGAMPPEELEEVCA
jgi:hypothetical protein